MSARWMTLKGSSISYLSAKVLLRMLAYSATAQKPRAHYEKEFKLCLMHHPTRKSVDEPQHEWGNKREKATHSSARD